MENTQNENQQSETVDFTNQYDEQTGLVLSNSDVLNVLVNPDDIIEAEVEVFDIDFFNSLKKQAQKLKTLSEVASIVPQYYEFKMSLESIMATANKKKAEERESYLENSLPECKTRGIYLGLKTIDVFNSKTQLYEKRTVCRWFADDKLYLNFGVQLINALRQVPIRTDIQITLVTETKVKSGDGSVKIYDVQVLG